MEDHVILKKKKKAVEKHIEAWSMLQGSYQELA